MPVSAENQDVIDRFIDALWLERGLSENTLGAYRRDLAGLAAFLTTTGVDLVDARAGHLNA